MIEAFVNLLGVEKHTSVPYSPQSKGKVERSIAEIVRHLKFIVNERANHDDWDVMLPMAVRIINANKHAAIGMSPAVVLLPGLKLDAHVFPEQQRPAVQRSSDNIGDKQRREEIQVYVQHLQELQVQAIRAADASQQKVVDKRMDKEDSETRSFQPGE